MSQTLLEKMGFSDPDRKDPMHDAACDYLATNFAPQLVTLFFDVAGLERSAERAVDALLVARADGTNRKRATNWAETPEEIAQNAVDAWQATLAPRTTHEFHVVKPDLYRGGPGQTVGFIDLHVHDFLDVEVKWCEYSVSDAIRQIGVYRENGHPGNWVLAAPYALNAEQKAALDSQTIVYVQLDRAKVEAFAKQRRATKVASPVF